MKQTHQHNGFIQAWGSDPLWQGMDSSARGFHTQLMLMAAQQKNAGVIPNNDALWRKWLGLPMAWAGLSTNKQAPKKVKDMIIDFENKKSINHIPTFEDGLLLALQMAWENTQYDEQSAQQARASYEQWIDYLWVNHWKPMILKAWYKITPELVEKNPHLSDCLNDYWSPLAEQLSFLNTGAGVDKIRDDNHNISQALIHSAQATIQHQVFSASAMAELYQNEHGEAINPHTGLSPSINDNTLAVSEKPKRKPRKVKSETVALPDLMSHFIFEQDDVGANGSLWLNSDTAAWRDLNKVMRAWRIPITHEKRQSLWDVGVACLARDISEQGKARAFLGKLIKKYGETMVAKAVAELSTKTLQPLDAFGFLQGILNRESEGTPAEQKARAQRAKVAL